MVNGCLPKSNNNNYTFSYFETSALIPICTHIANTFFDFDKSEYESFYCMVLWQFFHFFIPLCAGIVLQYIFPHARNFAATVLKWISPLAILYFTFMRIDMDMDLFLYGLYTWEVSHLNWVISNLILNGRICS